MRYDRKLFADRLDRMDAPDELARPGGAGDERYRCSGVRRPFTSQVRMSRYMHPSEKMSAASGLASVGMDEFSETLVI